MVLFFGELNLSRSEDFLDEDGFDLVELVDLDDDELDLIELVDLDDDELDLVELVDLDVE